MPLTQQDREDCKLGLAVEALRSCGMVRMKARGASMIPSIWPGDLLTVHSVTQDEVIPGDIVLMLRNQRCFIHRLVDKQPGENCLTFVTRGDAMPDNDPPIAVAELIGRVVAIHRGNRSFVPSQRLWLVHSAVAWVLCRSARVRSLAMRLHAAHLQGGKSDSLAASGSFSGARAISGLSRSRHL